MDTRHPDEGTIQAYVERQLPPAEQARVEMHVSSCAECAASVAETRGLIAAASRIVGALDNVPAKVIPVRSARRLPPWLAAAAVMVLAVGVSSVAVRSGLGSRGSASAPAADAVGALQQQPGLESQMSVAVEPRTTERAVTTNGGPPASGSAAGGRGEARRPGAGTTATPVPLRKESVREEAVALAAPTVRAPSAAAPPPKAEADFSTMETPSAVAIRATGAPAPAGRVAGRTQAPAPGDAVARSLRQSEAVITGRVMTENGQPLAGASVYINELNVSVITDAAGRYALTIPSDRVDDQAPLVRARAPGYSPQAQQLEHASGAQTADFELRRQPMQLSEVTDAREATVPAIEPVRTTRYEAAPGLIVELREFRATAGVPPARQGVNEYRWSDAAGTRRYVLSGSLSVGELERLAGRLGELRVIR